MMGRFLVFFIFIFNFQAIYAQENFVLNGRVAGRDTGIIILNYPNLENTFVHDTTNLTNGKFSFQGKINHPVFCYLSSNGSGNRTSLYLEGKNQKIFLKENHFEEMKMIGSFTQNQSDSLRDVTKKVESNNERIDYTISFIKSHPTSYVSTTELYGLLYSHRIPSETANTIFNTFSPELRKSSVGILIQSELERRNLGFPINDFTTLDVDCNQISTDQFRGKYVLINFWSSSCIPCIEKIPELKQLLHLYQKKGFEIINISTDTDTAKWKIAIKKYKLNAFQNVLSNQDIDARYSNTKEPIPSEILFSPDGKMLWDSKNENALSLEKFLEKCMRE